MVSKTGSKQSLVSGKARREAIARAVPELTDFLGRPPSLRDLAKQVGVSSRNAVREHIDTLIAEGRLVRDENGQVRVP